MTDEFMRGASSSLNKTMAELDAILDGNELTSAGKLREQLRIKLLDILNKTAEDWLKHGFRGGHNIAAKHFARTGAFPRFIRIPIQRNMPIRKVSPTVRSFVISSKLLKRYSDALDE